MAFSLGNASLREKNIQRLYTTTTQRVPPRRRTIPYQPAFIAELSRERERRQRERRFMEYLPKHDIELPRAPSFRCIRKTEVDKIVKRLMMAPKDRFNFKQSSSNVPYNDWRTAHEEKIRRLRDTLHMFGGGKLSARENQKMGTEEVEVAEIKPKKSKKEKKQKKPKHTFDASDGRKEPESLPNIE